MRPALVVVAKIQLLLYERFDIALRTYEFKAVQPAPHFQAITSPARPYASPKLRLPEAITPRSNARLCSSFKKE